MKTRQALLTRIREFLARTGMTERDFGLKAVGDHKLIPRLRAGRCTLQTIERAEAFMDGEHEADDAA